MLVKEAINGLNKFVITKNGKILGINSAKNELLDLDVSKIQVISGMYADITCIRI